MPTVTHIYSTGQRITLRGEDFLVHQVKHNFDDTQLLHVEGVSELVRGKRFIFDTAIEQDIRELDPAQTRLIADTTTGYLRTRLFLETCLRNAFFTSGKIEIAHKAAIEGADFQYTPALKALKLPRPRILIADAVGLGKTVECGILLAELLKRGQGQRVLVVALKSILAQFQQEIWNRFAIPLVRLDSEGIARIKAELPSNKNPFDYYDKVIISIDTLKNNAKFKHYLEKSRWDVVVIDEVHTVANVGSLRGTLAQFLATRCEAMILTSATPHNGRKESFANIITMLEPTAIPRSGDYGKADVEPYYVRRFKNDIRQTSARDQFRDREIVRIPANLTAAETAFLRLQQSIKMDALHSGDDQKAQKDFLFSMGLFKAYLSSPEACLESIKRRMQKVADNNNTDAGWKESNTATLAELQQLVEAVISEKQDSKYNAFVQRLREMKWQGKKSDERILVFAERIETLKALEIKLKAEFLLAEKAVTLFHGGMTDIEQQQAVEDFGKEDSEVRLFLASDAGSQGVNLHYYCHHLFNYDIPWSIITLEQRNGRIDRFGQTQTPFIYYLVAETDEPDVKTDLHIIGKLTEKEEEVYKTLGDPGAAMKLYDAAKEEQKVEKALRDGTDEKLYADAPGEDEFDYLSIFGAETDTTEVLVEETPLHEFSGFFTDDEAYYTGLIHFLQGERALARESVVLGVDGMIEFLNDPALNTLLYDLPPEAKPKVGDTYRLTTRKKQVEQAIAAARKKKGEWAKFQVLYDLHPIVRYLMNKLEANVDKDAALVVKTTGLPAGQFFYLFHGQVSNDLGQPVLSDFFVVVLDDSGAFLREMPLDEFGSEYALDTTLYTADIQPGELGQLQNRLPDAVQYARMICMELRKEKVFKIKESQRIQFEMHLENWVSVSKEQLSLLFPEETGTVHLRNRDKANREIDTILNEKSRFFKDMTSLSNDPWLRVLAVFFNTQS